MSVKVRIEMDPADKILLKRKLNQNGEARQRFTNQIYLLAQPYMPFRTGQLMKNVTKEVDRITHNQPYSARMYYNPQYHFNRTGGHPMAGAQWYQRMWNDRGKEIVNDIASFTGGKAE